MQLRLRQVAELAGVSEATVSRVLNDEPSVAESTRREVLRALLQLGHELVRISHTRRKGLIGLIIPEFDNPVFPRFAQAMEFLLAREALTTVLCTSTPSGMGEADYVEILLDHAVSGIVMISGEHADHSRYLDLAARGVPTVLVNGTVPDPGVSTVTVDHALAAKKGVAHLAALGHQRIGLALGRGRYVITGEFVKGYRRGLETIGLPLDEALISETLDGIEGGHLAGTRLQQNGATGIVCASDRIALGVIRSARDIGRNVPRDVSVIGFDDAGPNAYLDPPLTSLQQPFERMAEAVVDLLRKPTLDEDVASVGLRFAPELVVRASTGPAPPSSEPGPAPTGQQAPIPGRCPSGAGG